MKKLTSEELAVIAAPVMKAHGVSSVYCTEDGQVFLPTDKSLAIDHNLKNVNGKVFEITGAEKVGDEIGIPSQGKQEKMKADIEKARQEVSKLKESGRKLAEIRKELKKQFEADIVAIVTSKEAIREE